MLFVPFRADIDLNRIPILTVLVCVLCLLVYHGQYRNEQKVIESADAFCDQKGPVMWRMILDKVMGGTDKAACLDVLWHVHIAEDPEAKLTGYAQKGPPLAGLTPKADVAYKRNVLAERYKAFAAVVPKYETQQLWYHPASWDVVSMITAAFAHGSWMHVAGNLFFFFAFAATVEVIIGPLWFILVILGLAVGTHSFYSLAMLGLQEAVPTVGLSGVVMGIMALFTFFLPHGRIRCFFWFLLFIRIFAIPAWLLVAWYAGWDTYDLFFGDGRSGINLVAHVSGAAIGYLIGLVFFRHRRREVREMVAA